MLKTQIYLHSLENDNNFNYYIFLLVDKPWLNPQYHDEAHQHIKKPDEIENEMDEPPGTIDADILNRIQGSIIGMALGDALGAHVEFRPHEYMVQNPVDNLKGGGTWGLKKGQVGFYLYLKAFWNLL
jgi:hypothetical protein